MMKNDQDCPAEQQTPTCCTISGLFNQENREDVSVEFHSEHKVKERQAKR